MLVAARPSTRGLAFVVSGTLGLAACGGGGSSSALDGSATGDGAQSVDGAEAADARPGGPYVSLISADWTLEEPGDEGYFCATKTLTEDLFVGAIRPVAPNGTHHTTVDLTSGGGPDDPGSPCGVSFGQFYASGVGTSALVLPEGVGLVARAGMQVRLNLHLFNATDGPLSGTSGIEVQLLEPDEVEHPASISLQGPYPLDIPATGAPHEIIHEGGIEAGRTLVAIFPHMHQIGTHFSAKILRGGTPFVTLWDEPYQFETQEFELITPYTVQADDLLETRCTYVNDTGKPVGWGDSSKAEMCFTILMSY